MPGYKGHLFGGAAFYGCILFIAFQCGYYFSTFTIFRWLGFTLAGSLFPDIDTKSKGQKWLYRLLFVVLIFLLLLQRFDVFVGLSLLACLPLLVNHRGILHNIWFVIVLTAAIVFFIINICKISNYNNIVCDAFFFIIGVASHLWLDLGFLKMIAYKKRRRF